MPVDSSFTLTANDIFSSIANMIISQEVFANNLGKHQTLVDKARVDGSLYGDRKIYYATDVLKTHAWAGDSEAANVLALDRPADPKVQAIVLDQKRQIRLTVDNYLTKRAWADEGAFNSFQSVMLGQMRETKRLYEGTLYNVFIGTTEAASATIHAKSVTLSGTNDGQAIAKGIADLLVEMGDYSRDFNDWKLMRSYDPSQINVVWNADFVNKITKVDTPSIFHRDGLVDKLDADVMPAKYFGTIITSSNKDTYADNTPTTGKPLDKDGDYAYTPGTAHANGCVRTAVECDVTVSGTAYHLFPGEELPVGTKLAASATTGTLAFGQIYIVDAKAIAKVFVKFPPFMSGFQVETSFFNQRSLTENHYLTFMYNSLAYLKAYPFISFKKA